MGTVWVMFVFLTLFPMSKRAVTFPDSVATPSLMCAITSGEVHFSATGLIPFPKLWDHVDLLIPTQSISMVALMMETKVEVDEQGMGGSRGGGLKAYSGDFEFSCQDQILLSKQRNFF